MRIVAYNILEGGVGRADPLAEVVLSLRPDVVCLVEARDEETLARIVRRMSARKEAADVVHAMAGQHGAAIISRWPIIESINHGPLHPELTKSLVEVTVRDPQSGRNWVIGAVHLHAHALESDEQIRERELTTLLRLFDRHRAAGRPHLLCGDFNANSPNQRIEISKAKLATRDEARQNGGTIPRRVVSQLAEAGYIDTFAAKDAVRASSIGSFSTQYPEQRVDYIFSWGMQAPELIDAGIERDRLATYASDHYPVYAEFA